MIQNVSYRIVLNAANFANMTEQKVALMVRVPVSLRGRLMEIAKREHRSLSGQVELMLENCINREDQERKTGSEKRERRK
jgi:hypothetical protein